MYKYKLEYLLFNSTFELIQVLRQALIHLNDWKRSEAFDECARKRISGLYSVSGTLWKYVAYLKRKLNYLSHMLYRDLTTTTI